jgi:hypothetical protein
MESLLTFANSFRSSKADDLNIIRRRVGNDLFAQPPGDMAMGHVMTEHPFVGVLRMAHAAKWIPKMEGLGKSIIFHSFMMSTTTLNTSPTRLFIRHFSKNGIQYLYHALHTIT